VVTGQSLAREQGAWICFEDEAGQSRQGRCVFGGWSRELGFWGDWPLWRVVGAGEIA
jgi:hypothetical protein